MPPHLKPDFLPFCRISANSAELISYIAVSKIAFQMDVEQLKIDVDFMIQALKEAQAAAEEGEVPVGCVIVAEEERNGKKSGGGRIIARAHNLTETLRDPTAHAEMQAITSASAYLGGKYLDKCTLYVTVEPCPMCAAALNWAQIGRVVYGCDDPKRGASKFSPTLYHPKTIVQGGVLDKECSKIMTDFFSRKRKSK